MENQASFKVQLHKRQTEFAAMLGIDPESIRHLKLCSECGGQDYQWTDWSISEIDTEGLGIEDLNSAADYRAYLADNFCKACNGSGFEGASPYLNAEV
jgi:hypothetical protein